MSSMSELGRSITPTAVAERQAVLRRALAADGHELAADDPAFDFGPIDASVYERSCESLVGHVSIPVGVVGPLLVHYQDAREGPSGELVEDPARLSRSFFVPMATHEGGLNASLGRGIKAANESGGVTTYLLHAAMTRGSAYVFESTDEAYRFSKWATANAGAMQDWLGDPANPFRGQELGGIPLLSEHARLQAVRTFVLSNACHVVFEYSTGEACGQNMTTRNTYMLHSEFILNRFHSATGITPAHFFLEANTGGDKKSSHLYHTSGGHGRSVIASVVITDEVAERVLKCTVDDVLKLREVGGEGGMLSGMLGMAVNPVNVIAAIYGATGQDLACAGTSSMAIMTAAECPTGVQCTLRLPNLEVGTVGGGTGLPHQARFLELMGCRGGEGSANRFAQVVAAASLCLELSTGAAMAAAGSISFYTAHLTRGGMKRTPAPGRVAAGVAEQLAGEA